MSLQVWMPLVKDYENYGLSNLRFANFRYIRFVINAIRGGADSHTQLSRFEFIDAEGNLYKYPAGTTVSTSLTSYPANESPANVIDGNVNTKFCTSWAAGGYLTIALGSGETIDISRYSRFQWYTANDADWRDPVSFEVQFSNDGTNFVTGAVVTNASITTTRYALAYTGNCFNASAGKIGSSCYYNPSYDTGGLVSNTKINLGDKLSMCCWVKFSSLLSDSGLGGSMGGQHRYPNCTGMGLTIKYISSSTGYLSCNTGDGSNRTYNTYCGNTLLSAGTWYHVAFTYDGSTIRFYVNGNFDGSYSYTGQKNVEDYVFLGAWSFEHNTDSSTMYGHYKLNGCINDFRIYDHVLSLKEVKEISKGLVAHYQLKGMGSTNYLKGSGKYTVNSPLIRQASVNIGNMSDAYVYYDTTDLSVIIPSDGTYTWVLEADGIPATHNPGNYASSSRHFCMWLQNVSTSTHYSWGSLGTGMDGRHYGSVTVPAGTYKIRINLYSNDGADYYVKFWNMKIIQGNYNPSDTWCPHEEDELYNSLNLGSAVGTDCSGYGNNLEQVGTIPIENGSARFGSCANYNNSGYLRKNDFNMSTNQYTIAFWINPPYSINAQHFICGTFNSWTGNGFGMWRDSTGGGYSLLYRSNSEGSHTGSAVAPPHDTWSHIVIVYTGTQCIVYLNGAEVDRVNGGSSGIVSHPVLYLGNSLFNGEPASEIDEASMSDFRFYATALSASDIADLYKNSASVSKDGTLFAYDFHENKRNTIDKNGIVATSSLSNKSVSTYDMKIKTLGDGTTWARINHLDASVSKDWFASDAEVAKCIDKHNRYSRMGIVDKYKSVDNNTVFVLHGDSISDGSSRSLPVTNAGVTVSTSTYKTSSGSLYFNGSSRLTIPSWDLSASDFTIDWWEYPTSASNGSRFSSSYTTSTGTCGGLLIGYQGTKVYASNAAEGNWNLIAGATMLSVTANTWTHWAFVKSGNTLTSYRNGETFATATLSGNIGWSSNINFSIGDYRAGDHSYFTGYIDGFRISNIARWKSAFTPPSTSSEYEFMLTYPSMKKALPAGYNLLEYIEATGTQWINTGVTGYARWEFDIQFTNTTKRQLMGYYGSGDEYWGCQTDGTYGLFAGQMSVKAGKRDTVVHDYIGTGSSLWVQNSTHSLGGWTDLGTNQYQLFCIMSDSQFACHAKLWRCKCIQGGKLIRDFIPAMRTSDGYVGLLDAVNNVFYGNSGSGSFVADGAPVSPYIELYNRWIQTSSPNASPNTGTGFKAITTSFTNYFTPITKSASSGSAVYSMNTSNNWWAPIGQKVTFNNGIPAADGSTQYETELWVRTDRLNDTNQFKIFDGGMTASDYIEI